MTYRELLNKKVKDLKVKDIIKILKNKYIIKQKEWLDITDECDITARPVRFCNGSCEEYEKTSYQIQIDYGDRLLYVIGLREKAGKVTPYNDYDGTIKENFSMKISKDGLFSVYKLED